MPIKGYIFRTFRCGGCHEKIRLYAYKENYYWQKYRRDILGPDDVVNICECPICGTILPIPDDETFNDN